MFATKVINAANAGAVGVIIYQDQSNGIFYMAGLETTPILAPTLGMSLTDRPARVPAP